MQRLGHSKSLISWVLIATDVVQNQYQETGFTRPQQNDRQAVITHCCATQCARRFSPHAAMTATEVTSPGKCSASLTTAQKK
jgi:hypothetical protein